jgi:hypothetical protein
VGEGVRLLRGGLAPILFEMVSGNAGAVTPKEMGAAARSGDTAVRGWLDFGSGALGDIAPHSMNVIFLTLDLGAPSAIEVLGTSGPKKEMYPDSCIIRFDWAARGVHRSSASPTPRHKEPRPRPAGQEPLKTPS